jgi:hypothetical protein
MLSFDSPYEGKIFQKRGENFTLLTLNDLSYDKLVEKNINSKILQAFSIAPDKDSIKVTLKSDKNIAVIASKTVDGFGLRIRAKPILLATQNPSVKTVQNSSNANKTPLKSVINSNNEELIDSRYISVIAVLFIFLLFMLWLKYRLKKRMNNPVKNKKSWLFNPNSGAKETDVSILYKKPIDQSNSVILLEFREKQYLIVSGNSNVLLEKFGDNDIESNSDFEKAFEENRKKLDYYLKLQDSGINSYKSKASGEFNSQLESY